MKTITTPAVIEGIRAKKDRSLGLTVSTPELSTQEKALFMELQGINVRILIEPTEEGKTEEYKVAADLKEKAPSVRMRNVIFILWKQDQGEMDFDTYYKMRMEKIINVLKDQIKEEI